MSFSGIYKNKKVLITGDTGFKGSWLSTWLLKLGAEVFGISNDIPTTPSNYEVSNLGDRITHFDADIRDLAKIKEIVSDIKPDFVFHLAAQPIVSVSYSNPTETISTNVSGTANILESLRLSNHCCVAIIITSDKCYDNTEQILGYRETDHLGGKDIYSGSKGAAELIFKSYYHSFFNSEDSNIRLASARAGNVIGGGDWALDRIVPDCMRSWNDGERVIIRCPEAIRPWQHVLESLSGYLDVGRNLHDDKQLNGESFNFGPKETDNYTVLQLLKDLSKHWGFKDSSEAYNVTSDIKFNEAGLLKLNCDKVFCKFGWQTILNYEQLIEFTGRWYHEYYKNKKTNMFDFTISQIDKYEKTAVDKRVRWVL